MQSKKDEILKRLENFIEKEFSTKAKKKKDLVLQFYKTNQEKEKLKIFLKKNFSISLKEKLERDLENFFYELQDIRENKDIEILKKDLIKKFIDQNNLEPENMEEEIFINLINFYTNEDLINHKKKFGQKIKEQLNGEENIIFKKKISGLIFEIKNIKIIKNNEISIHEENSENNEISSHEENSESDEISSHDENSESDEISSHGEKNNNFDISNRENINENEKIVKNKNSSDIDKIKKIVKIKNNLIKIKNQENIKNKIEEEKLEIKDFNIFENYNDIALEYSMMKNRLIYENFKKLQNYIKSEEIEIRGFYGDFKICLNQVKKYFGAYNFIFKNEEVKKNQNFNLIAITDGKNKLAFVINCKSEIFNQFYDKELLIVDYLRFLMDLCEIIEICPPENLIIKKITDSIYNPFVPIPKPPVKVVQNTIKASESIIFKKINFKSKENVFKVEDYYLSSQSNILWKIKFKEIKYQRKKIIKIPYKKYYFYNTHQNFFMIN